MVSYSVRFKPSAQKELEALEDRFLERTFAKIQALGQNPRPSGCKKLKNSPDLWRIRVGDYRVVYSLNDKTKLVEVLRVRHRRDVYD